MKTKLKMIRARGTTPIARSLEEGAKDFPSGDARNIVILITDGKEECGMDPCAVSRLYQRKGIILKPFVIGLGLDTSYLSKFQCVGEFLSAENQDSFKSVLKFVISQALNNTTIQINLNNININTMRIYNVKNHLVKN